MSTVISRTILALFVSLMLWGNASAQIPVRHGDVAEIRRNDEGTEVSAIQLRENPSIFVLTLPTLAEQGAMFNRVVALIERAGVSRDEVLSDAALDEYIRSVGRTPVTFTFGNDFRVSELVKFFNLADRDGVTLTSQEAGLRDFITRNGLAKTRYGFLQVNFPDRIILSVPAIHSQELGNGGAIRINQAARDTILFHEIGHGEYYTNPWYADYCRRFWGSMPERERSAFRKFLGGRSYDTGNEELMVNEMQAYLMHTPPGPAITPEALGLSAAAIDALRQRFLAGNPPSGVPFPFTRRK